MKNKRRYLRAPVFLCGLLSSSETVENVIIENLGEGGALISSTTSLCKDRDYSLILELAHLPSFLKTGTSKKSDSSRFIRINLCKVIETRDLSEKSYKYSLIFDQASQESLKIIEQYVQSSKSVVEYLMALNSLSSPETVDLFNNLTNQLSWFDSACSISQQVKCMHQDLSWG